MDIKRITDSYTVSPQISAGDIPAIAAAGFTSIICNRPDAEISADQYAAVIQEAAQAAGLTFHYLPITQRDLTPDSAATQLNLMQAAEGPTFAYCRTGTRCSVLWAIGQAGQMNANDILSATSAAGYQLDQLRPYLESMNPA